MPRLKQFDEAEILQKAKELFWKQGYHATSIQNLVDHLGINRASIYDTFGGKNELYEKALAEYRKEGKAYLIQQLNRFDSAKKGIQKLFEEAILESLNDADCKGCFVVNCTTEYLPKHQHILADLIDNKNTFQKIITQTLKRGKDQGEFAKSMKAKEVAAYLFTFFSGLKVIAKVQQDQKELFKTIQLGLNILEH